MLQASCDKIWWFFQLFSFIEKNYKEKGICDKLFFFKNNFSINGEILNKDKIKITDPSH